MNTDSIEITPEATRTQTKETNFNSTKVLTLASAHAMHDTYAGFLAPLLPILIERLALLKVEAGVFLIFQQGPSLIQPVIGHLADRINFKQLVLISPAITGIMMSLFATARTYWMAALLLMVSGIFAAILHAIAPAIIAAFSGKQMGRGMSYWMVGGEIGVMLGPILISTTISIFSINAAPWLMIGGVVASITLNFLLRDVKFVAANGNSKPLKNSIRSIMKIFLPLSGILITRALLRAAAEIYLPVYLTERGTSFWLAGVSLTILEGAGILGILISGNINDRIGPRLVLIVSLIGSAIFMYLFLSSNGFLQVVNLVLLGLVSLAMVPIGMAIMQERFSENRSFANGLYLAMLFLVNGLAGVGMGWMCDHLGTQQAFMWSIAICLLGIPFVFMLPSTPS